MYNIYLREWLRLKPPEHVHVLQLEDWHDNCETLLPKIFRFLELGKTIVSFNIFMLDAEYKYLS